MYKIEPMKMVIKNLGFLLLIIIIFPSVVFGRIGVGVGTGKIQVDEKLRPGTIYNLPSLAVINTGDEFSEYQVSISFQQNQPEIKPDQSWFVFSPEKFSLNPGEVKNVSVKINLPLKMVPGNYFSYLEAQPLKKVEKGKTSIGVAAAAKLYFTVVPSNIFQSIYYKVVSFYKVYTPWPQRGTLAVCLLFIYLIAKKYLNIKINFRSGKKEGFKQNGENE